MAQTSFSQSTSRREPGHHPGYLPQTCALVSHPPALFDLLRGQCRWAPYLLSASPGPAPAAVWGLPFAGFVPGKVTRLYTRGNFIPPLLKKHIDYGLRRVMPFAPFSGDQGGYLSPRVIHVPVFLDSQKAKKIDLHKDVNAEKCFEIYASTSAQQRRISLSG